MEQNQVLQYVEILLQWTRKIKGNVKSNVDNNQALQGKLDNLEKELLNSNKRDFSHTAIALSKQADEIYEELIQGNVKNIETSSDEKRQASNIDAVPIGEHKLPPLPYPYNALQPYIDEEIMRLHHSQHHRGYVEGLNKAEKEMLKARQKNNYDLIKHWEREAAFNGAGHYLHTIFWSAMNPKGGGNPKGSLAKQIETDFGNFELFKQHFSEAAKKVEAVGWAILVWSPRSRRLEILQAEKHQNLSQWDVIPILPLDVWEHAYYLQYKNERALYVDNWWNVVDWDHADERFEKAKQLMWEPY